ncbi:hypothetical protein Hanom_Chr09g00763401 [Helianthus anomalus]
MRPWRTLPLLADVRPCKAAVDRGNGGAHQNWKTRVVVTGSRVSRKSRRSPLT